MKLLVLPSFTEGLPNILLEAMACGTPVLATPVGAIKDIIKESETGFLLKSDDPIHIAERIIELLNNPELLEEVSIKAYNYVRENFSFEKTLDAWRKILSEL
jgi:glycosyltransferase involved in cell wall biosynthesis